MDLALIGENDDFLYCAKRALEVGSGIDIHVLAGQGHLSAISDPEFARIIAEFLAADR